MTRSALAFPAPPPEPRPLLSAVEVGKLLRVSAKTVRRLPIPSVRVGTGRRPPRRYRIQDVERWIEEHTA